MWIAKLKINHKSRIAERTKKYGVLCYSILLTKYIKKIPLVSGLHYIVGEEKSIQKFINDLKKDKGVKRIEHKSNVFSMLEYAKDIPSFFLEPEIFFIKPVLSNIDGYEYWEIASWEKSRIDRFIRNLGKSKIDVKIQSIIQSKLSEIHFPKIMPKLTKKQKKAIEIAIINGYYQYPRKKDLKDLAGIMHIGISTFQEHLRRAENKIIPLFSEFE